MEGRKIHPYTLALLSLIVGCNHGEVPPYPSYAPPVQTYQPVASSENGFDTYALVAKELETLDRKSVSRVAFHPQQRKNALASVAPLLPKIRAATQKPFSFKFVPRTPFGAAPYQSSWRLIGRAMAWQVEDAVAAGQWDTAIDGVVTATRFGFDLTGGAATEGSLGFSIVDDVRRAIAPSLDKLSVVQLHRLTEGLKLALRRKPHLSLALEHERMIALSGLQSIQDDYREGQFKDLDRNLGPDGSDAVTYLKSLTPSDRKRVTYFDSFHSYIEAESAYAAAIAPLPASERTKIPAPIIPKNSAWHRIAKYLTRGSLVLIEMNDATVARTRLLVIESELTRQRKLKMTMPANLSGFSGTLATDPYSGHKFGYRHMDTEYQVYSVGPNLTDDDGQTDADYANPDLVLEKPAGTN